MVELHTPAKLMDDRLGHADGSIGARYTHITAIMRQVLMNGLTELWNEALHECRQLTPSSPVAVLDRLLNPRKSSPGRHQFEVCTEIAPNRVP